MYDEWGIAHGYHDVNGQWHDTPPVTRDQLRALLADAPAADPLWFVDEGSSHAMWGRCRLTLEDGSDRGEVDHLPGDVPIGYHVLTPLDGGPATKLVVAPRRCPAPPRGWGVAAQVYSLWRHDGWGIGDLRDVAELGQHIAARGAVAVLLSPLHAPAPTHPQESSPYYPSSRRWLNPLLIPIAGERPGGLTNAPGTLIDRDGVWSAKRSFLAQRFAAEGGGGQWRSWARAQGPDLWRFATWNALADRHGAQWAQWPEHLRHPDSPAVGDLPLHDHSFANACEFHAWLQWLARAEVRHATAAAGVALISDLAVGNSPDGADAWIYQDLIARGVRIGAPPDPFNADGQDWGLPPFVPSRLRAAHYAPFIAMLRAACEGMGGVRIDHVMGLFRQFWVPDGGSPADGAYVQMPAQELLAIIRLEATRAGTFVVGEDLGTVQPGVREAMRDGGMLGTKVWWFDPSPAEWPEGNLATVTTHDLPTVAGVCAGTDGNDEMRALLTAAVGTAADAVTAAVALHAQVTASDCVLTLAAFDDLAGCTERPNRPGTVDRANWSLRMPGATEQILTNQPGREIVDALASRTNRAQAQ
ncbi:MAG: 4-alpha-glucanotransferase [Actinomycetota bacterium]|nr:4-alpha-glucanotransferase [Actinomycetota bacterium]